jgi:phosphatidylinositol-3-phosphatase
MQLSRNAFIGNWILAATLSIAPFIVSGCGGTGQPATSTIAASAEPAVTPVVAPSPAPAPTPAPSPTPTPTPTPAPQPTPTSGIPHSSHVVLVIEENHMFTEVYPNGMPWLVAQGNTYAYSTNYHADEPGSALDYYWLSSGSGEHVFGCQGDGCPNPITSDNIFQELDRAGLTWKVYAQSLPSVGYMGGDAGPYVDRHNPAKWYDYVIHNPAAQQKMVPFTQLAADIAANQVPNYSLIIPDVDHDAHDGTVAQADSFLATGVAPLLNTPYFKAGGDGLLLVTFDECDGAVGACPEQVYTAVIGPNVKRKTVSSALYKHENTLRTMLDALGITVYPGASSSAADMTDFF